MQKLRDVRVGDKITIHDVNLGTRKRTVDKVGNKWLHAGNDRFDRDTGRIDDDFGHATAYAVEAWDYLERVRSARRELIDFGLTSNPRMDDDLLLKVHEVLKPLMEKK